MIPTPRQARLNRVFQKTARHATLAILAAAALSARAADQSAAPSPVTVSAVIRADFPYAANSTPSPAETHRAAGAQSFQKAKPLPAPTLQWKETAPAASKTKTAEPVVTLPEYTVWAQKYLPLGNRLDQIDEDIRREESFTKPGKADLFLNGDKASNFLQKFLVSFGAETAQKRARDANKRIEVLEMRRIVEIGLPFAAPGDKERLKNDRTALEALSAHQLDQPAFSDPRTKAGN